MAHDDTQRSLFRFLLRGLCYLITLAGVACAVAVWLLNALPTDIRRGASVLLVSYSSLALVLVAHVCWLRAKCEKAGGRLLWQATTCSASGCLGTFLISLFLFGVLCLVLSWSVFCISVQDWLMFVFAFPFAVVPLRTLLLVAVRNLWWKIDASTLEAWQNGLNFGGVDFLSWSKMVSFHWNRARPGQCIVCTKSRAVVLDVFPLDQAPLDGLLREHVPSPSLSPTDDSVPILPLERPASATVFQWSVRGLIAVTAGVAILCWIFTPLTKNPSWLDGDLLFAGIPILLGMVFATLCCRKRWRNERQAGERILIHDRRHEPGERFHVEALVVYFVGLGWIVNDIDGNYIYKSFREFCILFSFVTSSIAVGIFVDVVIHNRWWNLDRESLEIFQNGFILGGNHFFRWDAVLEHAWDKDVPGLLTLKLRDRIVRVQVPSEDRETLDRLIGEHVLLQGAAES